MNDTPDHIKELQLKIWLSKTPGERLYQFLIDNDKMYQAILAFKKASVKTAANVAIVEETPK